jgi:hypothetical protein
MVVVRYKQVNFTGPFIKKKRPRGSGKICRWQCKKLKATTMTSYIMMAHLRYWYQDLAHHFRRNFAAAYTGLQPWHYCRRTHI